MTILKQTPKVLVITGPTAVGKTFVGHNLALYFDGEIISADSRQIYKYLDIGTAKPKEEFTKEVNYHLISIINPDCEFSAYDFKKEAEKKIQQILQKGKLPIVVGGSGLYIKSLVDGLFDYPPASKELRANLEKEPIEYLWEKLKLIDSESACRISKNDKVRIIRALEVFYLTGYPISYLQKNFTKKPDYFFIKINLNLPREQLYEKINQRVDLMIKEGLLDEVKKLIKMGYSYQILKKRGIGYKELVEYIEGKTNFEEAISLIKKNTRNYAKRQITFFKQFDCAVFSPYDKEIIEFVEFSLKYKS